MDDPRRTIDALCAHTGRVACSDAERRAAAWLHDDLRARGHEAWVETVWVRPQWAWSLALHCFLVALAGLVAVAAPLPGLIVAAAGAASLAVEASGRAGPLRLLFHRRATQNVLTEPAGGAPVTLLICARTDAPRGGAAGGERARAAAAAVRRALGGRGMGPRAWLALAAAAVAGTAAARLAGAEGLALGVAQLVPTIFLLAAAAAAADLAVSPGTPGAGDNASGVAAALLALHDDLVRRPPAALSPALVLFGAGDGGAGALRTHLRRERVRPREAAVLELWPCGAGEPQWATGHGLLARAAAESGAARTRRLPWASGAGAARSRRLPALAVGCADPRGIVPRARTAGDVPEAVDPAAVAAAVAAARAVVDALDAELAAADAPARPVGAGGS